MRGGHMIPEPVPTRAGRALLIVATVIFAACRGRSPEPDVGRLIADLNSPDPEVSGRASLALIRIGEPAAPALIEMLRSEDARFRRSATTTLWGMGPRGKMAVPALASSLADRDADVRVGAAMALENMGPDARQAVPALIGALKDRNGRVRQWAAKALGSIGPAAREALPALAEAATFEPIRPAVEEAIQKIQRESESIHSR